jgi:hypothetical protein
MKAKQSVSKQCQAAHKASLNGRCDTGVMQCQLPAYLRCEHVDEGIPHIALVLEVNGEVEEVKGALELLLNRLQHSSSSNSRKQGAQEQ